MASKLWFCLVIVFSCLLQSTLSDKKKKIIVKVPHVIKHIHHDVFKPVHIHKIRGKKLEHHHHEEHEEKIKGWKPVKNSGHKKIKHYKPYGSHSQIQPVLAQHNIEDHNIDYSPSERQEQQGLPQEHRSGHDFIQEELLHLGNKPGKRKAKFIGNRGTTSKYAPWGLSGWKEHEDYSGEALEDFDDYSEEPERVVSASLGQRRKRHKKINSKSNPTSPLERTKTKYVSPLLEDSGWTPLQGYDGWKDFDSLGKKARAQANPFKHPQEGRFGGQFEEHIYEIERDFSDDEYRAEAYQKNKRFQKNKPKWSKQIDVKEPTDEYESAFGQLHGIDNYQVENPVHFSSRFPSQNHQNILENPKLSLEHSQSKQMNHQSHQNQPIETPEQFASRFNSQNRHNKLGKPQSSLRNFQTQQFSAQSHQDQPTSWSLQVQQPQPNALTQPTNNIWHTQPSPVVQPTQPSKVVWSGHHLQMPQSSMWHVQQHSVQGDASQMFSNFHPPLQVHSPPLQVQQESTPMKQVLPPPGWPLNQKSQGAQSPVRQQWEQHVQTSGSDGPASSYKLEVINYMDQKMVHH